MPEIAAMLEDGREIAFLDVHGGRLSNRRQGSKRSVNLRDGFHHSYPPSTRTFALASWAHHNGCMGQTTFRGNVDAPVTVRAVQACIRTCYPCRRPVTHVLFLTKSLASSEGGRNRA
jgi:hypothetical protein